MVSIFIADDHNIVRMGIKALFDGVPGYRIAGEACDGAKAVDEAVRLKPDVVIMDMSMPGFDGVEAARRIAAKAPGVKVVIFSMHRNRRYAAEAFAAGAYGYVLKGEDIGEIVTAVDAVSKGNIYVSPGLSADPLEGKNKGKGDKG